MSPSKPLVRCHQVSCHAYGVRSKVSIMAPVCDFWERKTESDKIGCCFGETGVPWPVIPTESNDDLLHRWNGVWLSIVHYCMYICMYICTPYTTGIYIQVRCTEYGVRTTYFYGV